jgi:hypothetical protein
MTLSERSIKFRGVALFGIIGFFLGVICYYIYLQTLPNYQGTNIFLIIQELFSTPWIQWGLVGALISIIFSLAYACLS